jgi:FkbM family methyltransferase
VQHFIQSLPKFLRRQKLLVALTKLGLASPVQRARFNDEAFAYLDLRDAESRATFLSQSFWPEFHPMVKAFLKEGDHIFDVGANFGLVSFGVASTVKNISFHLFEANSEIIPLLKRSASLYPNNNFLINHCCVSDEVGVSKLTLPDSSWGHGYIGSEGFEVNNLLLDQYIDRHKIKRIAFMKMDIEGFEPKALKGAEQSLSAGIVKAAFIEVCLDTLGTSGNELLAQLQAYGFDIYFCSMFDSPDPYNLIWRRVDVNGTSLRFAKAFPLPATYLSGDVMAVHRSTPLAGKIRATLIDHPQQFKSAAA